MRLEHIGIAVGNIDDAVDTYSRLLENLPYKVERVESEQVDTHFLWADGVKIELLAATSDDSVIHKFIQKRGEGLHHLAFSVDDLSETAERLSRAGFRIIDGETLGTDNTARSYETVGKDGADGKSIFFLHPKDTHGVLIECCSRSHSGLTPRESATIPCGKILLYGGSEEHDNPPLLLLTAAAGPVGALQTAEIISRLEPTYRVYHLDLKEENVDVISVVNNDVMSGIRGTGGMLLTLGISAFYPGQALMDAFDFVPRSWIHVDPDTSTPPSPPPPDIRCLFVTSKSSDAEIGWPVSVLPRAAINPQIPTRDALIPVFLAFWDSQGQ